MNNLLSCGFLKLEIRIQPSINIFSSVVNVLIKILLGLKWFWIMTYMVHMICVVLKYYFFFNLPLYNLALCKVA